MAEEVEQKVVEPAKGEKPGDGGGEVEEKVEEVLSADDFEPEVRSKPWSNREERAEFFKAKQKKEKEEEREEDDIEGSPADINDRIERAVEARLGNVIDKRLGEFAKSQDEVLLRNEMSAFLADPKNASFKKYAARAEKAAKVYQNVPVALIFRGLAYDDAFIQGAERKGEVDKKLAKNKISGTTKRQAVSGLPDFKKMTPEELRSYNARIPREGIKVEE